MEEFDPLKRILGAAEISDNGEWPDFSDAIVYSLNFWRGDIRPENDVWVSPSIDATLELAALEVPFVVDLRFHDCDHIEMHGFNYDNIIDEVSFSVEARGFYADGVTPLPPYINVTLGYGYASSQLPLLAFKCMRIEVLQKRETPSPPCR
jgi:hypothetical protein